MTSPAAKRPARPAPSPPPARRWHDVWARDPWTPWWLAEALLFAEVDADTRRSLRGEPVPPHTACIDPDWRPPLFGTARVRRAIIRAVWASLSTPSTERR